ncbi:MAG TPA: GGDEF domain-containing protein [Steroidobacteraceae bacterium]|nr:GGDEF domain-containing protein [Steroidobacteraceae bacterium]
MNLDPQLLAELLRHSPDGLAVLTAAPAAPRISYWNTTLASLLRRPEDWLEGRTLEELEAEAPTDPSQTITNNGVRVRLKRADGTQVECERWAVLLPQGPIALYYRPVPRRAPGVLNTALDHASNLGTPEHLLEVLRRDWSIGQRDGVSLTLMRFEVDALKEYQGIFGRGAGENVVRQLGRTVATAMRRASDVVARHGEDVFVVLAVGMPAGGAKVHAEQILERVRSLAIHHPRSPTGRYLTMSAGVATVIPARDQGAESLIHAVEAALRQARADGGNRVVEGAL